MSSDRTRTGAITISDLQDALATAHAEIEMLKGLLARERKLRHGAEAELAVARAPSPAAASAEARTRLLHQAAEAIERAKEELTRSKHEIDQLTRLVAERDTTIAENAEDAERLERAARERSETLQRTLGELAEKEDRLEAAIAARDEAIAAWEEDRQRHEARVGELAAAGRRERRLADRAAELEGEMKMLEGQIRAAETLAEELRTDREDLKRLLRERGEQIAAMRAAVQAPAKGAVSRAADFSRRAAGKLKRMVKPGNRPVAQ